MRASQDWLRVYLRLVKKDNKKKPKLSRNSNFPTDFGDNKPKWRGCWQAILCARTNRTNAGGYFKLSHSTNGL